MTLIFSKSFIINHLNQSDLDQLKGVTEHGKCVAQAPNILMLMYVILLCPMSFVSRHLVW